MDGYSHDGDGVTMDAHDSQALAHYEQLISLRYPPHLAAALAAARYQVAIGTALPAVREVVSAVGDRHPALRRTAGQLVEKIEGEMGLPATIHRRNNRRS